MIRFAEYERLIYVPIQNIFDIINLLKNPILGTSKFMQWHKLFRRIYNNGLFDVQQVGFGLEPDHRCRLCGMQIPQVFKGLATNPRNSRRWHQRRRSGLWSQDHRTVVYWLFEAKAIHQAGDPPDARLNCSSWSAPDWRWCCDCHWSVSFRIKYW